MAQSEMAVASAVTETSTTIESTKEILLPGAGSARLSNFDISNNGNNIMARDSSTGREFIPVAYEIDDDGTSRGFRETTGAREITPAAADTSEEFTGNIHQFVIPNANRGWADRYTFIRSMDAAELDDCDITIRYDSHTGPVAFRYTAENNGGEGFTLIAGDGNAETRAPVELVRSAFFETGVIIYVTISSPAGSNLQLRGQTIDFGTVGGVVIGSQQVPYIEVYGRVATVTPLADTADIVSALTGGTHSSNVSITGAVDGDGNPTVNINVTGGGTGPSEPRITSLSIQGQATSVNPDTQLTGQLTFNFAVMLPGQVDGGHWHDRVDEVETAEAEIIIPQSKTGSVTVQIDIQLDNNGTDEGTHEETVTITNVGADQNLGQRTFDFAGFPSVTCNITYEHDNNDLSVSRRVIFLRPTQPFTNAALTYNVSAHDRITETWNVATTYARDPINAGSGHDDFGLFDPHLWETEQLDHRNRVILAVGPYRQNDSDTDPEMAVRVVVDGELHGTGDPIRLHRPASDFTFDDMSFGNNNVAIAHIQVYDYDGPMPSGPELLRLYSHQADWLGAFWPPGHAVDDVIIDANIELSAGHGIILTDATTGQRRLIEWDNGDWTDKSP